MSVSSNAQPNTPSAAAVTRKRLAGLKLLAALPIVGIQEGGSVVRVELPAADASDAAAAAASSSATAAASSSAAAASSASSIDALPQLESSLSSLQLLRVSSSFVCSTCRVAFELGDELRAHARTSWHVHNVRAASRAEASSASPMRKQEDPATAILTELQFEELQQQTNAAAAAKKNASASDAQATGASSSSAAPAAANDDSASSGLSSDDENSDARRKRSSGGDDDDASNVVGSSRVTFFTPTQRVTVWKQMLVSPLDPAVAHVPLSLKVAPYVSALRSLPSVMQVSVLMVSGGRFSAAVWRGEQLLVSKSYQRYTTRRKQGGSQSAHDASKGAAQSIGASIRRKETVRFWEEAGRILSEWAPLLAECQRIFLFAPGANRQQLLRPPVPLDKRDERLRAIPFPTYRPTLAELQRVHLWLGTVEFEERDNPPADLEQLLAEQQNRQQHQPSAAASKKQQAAASAAASAAATPAPIAVSALASLPSHVLDDAALNAAIAGDVDLLQSLITSGYERPVQFGDPRFKPLLYAAVDAAQENVVAWLCLTEYIVGRDGEGVDEQVLAPLVEEGKRSSNKEDQTNKIVCWGALHLACARGQEELVLALLRAGADPLRRDSRNRLPAQLLPSSASGSATRLAVRRLAGSSAAWETRWDWSSAEFGPPLSAEGEAAAEEARKQKAKEKKKAAAARAKERAKDEKEELARQVARDEEAARLAQQQMAIKASAAVVKQAASARAQAQAGLSEREKRALAAERRLGAAKGTGPVCALCANAITKAPFERLDFKYCSIACLQQHKLQLDATEAAAAAGKPNPSKVITHNPR
jgi:hypothetical protein